MKEIQGNAKKLRSLLSGARFAIDYYQREYRWEKKHVAELIHDLHEKFVLSHKSGNERSEVIHYGHYFLGSIIVCNRDGQSFIIDGQQRLTTLTLLLIFIYKQLPDPEDRTVLSNLIFTKKYGTLSFNIDVEERTDCMYALFNNTPIDEAGQSESVVNIVRRYRDLEELFPIGIKNDELPHFADWLIENVFLVEITAYSDADAYTIFETMNDRGLSLRPTDMLKGYLLANIKDAGLRDSCSDMWRKTLTNLREIGKEEDTDAIKAWLRSQHAHAIRKRTRDALPGDFDRIGTEFHRWVRENEQALLLSSSLDFAQFIKQDFTFYCRWYGVIRQAAKTLTPNVEAIYYCAQNNFTLQYPILLAPLHLDDDEQSIYRKLGIVSTFLDILITRRIWNFKSIDYNTMEYAMYTLIRDIRGKRIRDLVDLLEKYLAAHNHSFDEAERPFGLHLRNSPSVHRILARLTDYVEVQSGRASRYCEYIRRSGKHAYEIEHIWANNYEINGTEFDHPHDFDMYRNRIGGLLLLPKKFNASYGALPFSKKHKHYVKQNLLAMSLHGDAYDRDPGFSQFVAKSGLCFKPHSRFRKEDLDARQTLYTKLAEQIWNPGLLKEKAK